jgi:hypothetical protein
MDALHRLHRLYRQPGPFATVYLDASRQTESGAQEIELRWREARHKLGTAGAPDGAIEALGAAIEQGPDRAAAGPHGRVLVAAGGAVEFDEILPVPPAQTRASWSPVPHLMPYFARRGPTIGHVIVVADRTGADLAAVTPGAFEVGAATVEATRTYPIHKSSTADWSERHFQRRVDQVVEHNAREIADVLAKLVTDVQAELVVIAGDPRVRGLLRDDLANILAPHSADIVSVPEGGRGDGASAAALDEAVHRAVLRRAWGVRHRVLEHLRQNVGRNDHAATGVEDVMTALREARAATVIVSDDPSSPMRAWVGPEPVQFGLSRGDLDAMGVSDPQEDRFDAALVRAAIGTGADLVVTPNAHHYLPGGVAALLR